jgi:hypothetical protein
MVNKFDRFYWHRQPAIDDFILRFFADCLGPEKLVVDVGAGYDPWAYATEFVDMDGWDALRDKRTHYVDLEVDPLPFADKSVDFLYCRHTLEDMHCPLLLCREMNRVAKAGYIETPSPMAEFCRGIDAGGVQYRGYVHHRWFVWVENSTLMLLPKYTLADVFNFDAAIEAATAENLTRSPILWNTYCCWRGEFAYKMSRPPIDFQLTNNYHDVILAAVDAGARSTIQFMEGAGLATVNFEFVTAPDVTRTSLPRSSPQT